MQQRDVAIFGVPGDFLKNALQEDKFLLMQIRDEFVDVMCEFNPEYIPYVRYDFFENELLYVNILRAIYECIKSALLWYRLYSETLGGMGFVINPYYPCVANKMINGEQCTTVWYVNDNKLSHVNSNIFTGILEEIKKYFGELVKSRGDQHEILCMKIKARKDKLVKLSMTKKLEKAIKMFESTCGYAVTTPGAPHLWK